MPYLRINLVTLLILVPCCSVSAEEYASSYSKPVPTDYPKDIPPGPYSGLGKYQQDASAREYFENLRTRYRADTARAKNELRVQREAWLDSRERRRQERAARVRERNMRLRAAETNRRFARAQVLYASICDGTSDWPAMLQGEPVSKKTTEFEELVRQSHGKYAKNTGRLEQLATELRRDLHQMRSAYTVEDRSEAARFVALLETIAGSTQRVGLTQH